MGFLSPWFLLGLAALGLPVYVHLLRRHILPPQPFSSLMFFERGIQSSTRHRRLRYLLLFALRSALLLLLVLAFASPFIRTAATGEDNKLLLVVVDDSFSMRAGSRFADAKQGALELLASRPRSRPAEVMALGGRLMILTQPIQDAALLRSAVESIQPSDSRANLGELARGVRTLADSVKTPVELHLFSDMQKTGMPANFSEMELPAGVSVILHPVGMGAARPNWTVESVRAPVQIADPKDPKKSRVQAMIAGYQTPAATRTVSLIVNGKTVEERKVEAPANGRTQLDFTLGDLPYGLNRCAVKIDSADIFPADDMRVFAVKRADPEHVLFVHRAGDTRSGLYFGAALAAASQAFTLQPIESSQAADIDPGKYAFVVLSDVTALPSVFENALTQYVRRGGNVLIAAGTAAAHHAPIPIFGGYTSEAHTYGREGYATVAQTDLTYPVMKDPTGWSDLKFYYVARVDAPQARVIARLTDQTPLILERQIEAGHVLLFASGFDGLTNDLPLRPAFVPFVDRAAQYLSGSEGVGGSMLVDSPVGLRSAGEPANAGAGVEVLDPDGHRALSLSEAASAQSFTMTRSGFYQIRFANGRTALIGVNPDPRESDLAPIPNDLLGLWSKGSMGSTDSGAPAYSGAKNTPRSLWWYVMLLVLAAAIAECIVSSRYLGTQREEA